jgi:glycolate oxidase iron-sulfur subunit
VSASPTPANQATAAPPGPPAAARFLDYDKSLACIHCGLCLAACPTYLETGNENDSPRGRIYLMRAVQEGRLPLDHTPVRHIDLCLGCRACEAVCPSGVQYGELLEATREHVEKNYQRPWLERFLRRVAIERVFPFPARLKAALLPAKIIQGLRLEALLPKFARDALALLPESTPAVALPELSAAARRTGEPLPRRVGFITGCVMSVLFGPTNLASVRLLNRAGCDVVAPRDQVCCGALYAHGGNLEHARDCARRNIAAFERLELDAIIINAAGCGSTLKEYGHLLHDDPQFAERARRFSAKVRDLTEWLVEGLGSEFSIESEVAGRSVDHPARITYHDACHLAHPQRITKQPRELVKGVAGAAFTELPEADVCCGSAGSYNLTEPEMAERLQRRKVENILRTGAQVVVTTNPGCLLQIRAGLRKAGVSHIRALHIADFLEEALRRTGGGGGGAWSVKKRESVQG